jgi:hypothetical protein
MDNSRWRRVEELYRAVLDHPPEKRDDFLASACREDLELRREVESMLRHDKTNRMFDEPERRAQKTRNNLLRMKKRLSARGQF